MTTKPLRTEPQKRLYSLDALRGFDMFWITGGSALAVALAKTGEADWILNQMRHVPWEGFHFMDLIFPLFMFIAGVAIPLSIEAKHDKNVPRKKLLWKAFKRMAILILLGILYNGTLRKAFGEGRIPSVLGQIGVGYFLAATIVIYFHTLRSRLIWLAGILTGIGIIQLLIPVAGHGAGALMSPEGCINGVIDRLFLSGRMYRETYDPEGILCSISAAGVTLMGAVAGTILRNKKTGDWKKIGYLTASGVAAIGLALALSPLYPIIKSCWTSTFNLLTGGISFLMLAFFYLIIDHWGLKSWAFYFRVIGMNSIFVYLFVRLVNVSQISEYFLGWLAIPLGDNGKILLIIGNLAVVWLLLFYMYKKKIFLRV